MHRKIICILLNIVPVKIRKNNIHILKKIGKKLVKNQRKFSKKRC